MRFAFGFDLPKVLDLAQREWMQSTKIKDEPELWNTYKQLFDAKERISTNPDSLGVLKRRAKRHQYSIDMTLPELESS